MGSIFRTILQNAGTRVILMIFLFIVGITAYFLVTGYYTQLDLYERGELDKLSGVSKTLALQIDGNAHQLLYEQNTEKDAIKKSRENDIYLHLHQILKKAYNANGLESAIYTMVYDADKDVFNLVVTSDEKPYFRHPWTKFKQIGRAHV